MIELLDVLAPELVAAIERLVDERVELVLAERKAADPVPPVMNLEEAAEYLRVSVRLVQRLIARDELPVTRLGRRVLVRRADLDEYLQRSRVEP